MSSEENYKVVTSKINTFLDCLFSKNNAADEFPRPTRSQVIKIARTLSHEITKISLLLQDLRAKPEFFSNIEECLDNLFSVFQGISAHSEAEESLGDDEENVISKQTINVAWKCCEDLESIPLRNTTAIILRVEEITSLIKDAQEEVEEFRDKIERLSKEYGDLSKTVDDVVSGIYPPQNHPFLSSQLSLLSLKINNITQDISKQQNLSLDIDLSQLSIN
eukprot:gene2077-2563_t